MKLINRGFTLLELLVVIGVIGALLSFITVSFTSTQKQGRDARRREDLKAIQNALEQYYTQNSFVYPTCASGQPSNCAAIATYFVGSAIPSDPLNTGSFVYNLTSASASYTLTARLEKDNSLVTVTNLQ